MVRLTRYPGPGRRAGGSHGHDPRSDAAAGERHRPRPGKLLRDKVGFHVIDGRWGRRRRPADPARLGCWIRPRREDLGRDAGPRPVPGVPAPRSASPTWTRPALRSAHRGLEVFEPVRYADADGATFMRFTDQDGDGWAVGVPPPGDGAPAQVPDGAGGVLDAAHRKVRGDRAGAPKHVRQRDDMRNFLKLQGSGPGVRVVLGGERDVLARPRDYKSGCVGPGRSGRRPGSGGSGRGPAAVCRTRSGETETALGRRARRGVPGDLMHFGEPRRAGLIQNRTIQPASAGPATSGIR
ncbi:hypothetical protein STENM223S_08584 [Streptomyces tendae]